VILITSPKRFSGSGITRGRKGRGPGVHDPSVDVAEFGQSDQVGGMLVVAELLARRLVDRHRHGGRGRIAAVPRVEHERLRMLALGRYLDLQREGALGRHFATSKAREVSSIRANMDDPAFT
jgi:hypothetical protein